MPSPIPDAYGVFRGRDDVREEDGLEDSADVSLLARPGEEFLNLVENLR